MRRTPLAPVFYSDVASVYHCDHTELARAVGRVDAVIVDAPYSERTHAGHDTAAASKNEERGFDGFRGIAFRAWNAADVDAFVDLWSPVCAGWFVTITDHVLAPAWAAALERHGRYVFSPLACVEPGSRIRVVGDGPSQWSCFAIVARPRTPEFLRWGTLPGAYVVPRGAERARSSSPVVGGKSSWLMERLVCDYSRPGDLVCDPCCGGGTTLRAAVTNGRRAVGGDVNLRHAELASSFLKRGCQMAFDVGEVGQPSGLLG